MSSSLIDTTAPATISGFTGANLSALAAGAYALLQTAPVSKQSGVTRWGVRLTTSVATSAQVNLETLSLHLIEARDGTNYADPPGTSAIAPSADTLATQYTFTGGATTIIDFPDIEASAYASGLLIHNNSASVLPTATWAVAVYGYTTEIT
jgi:hypothetical protein